MPDSQGPIRDPGSAATSRLDAGPISKRLIDIALSLAGFVVLAPLMVIIGLMIRATMGSPVLFRQQRPGLRGKPFELVKFRTMREAYGPDGQPLPSKVRLTRLGYALRRLSLDELPELWNILRGDMSVVGPRPLLMEYLPRYSPEQARRHDMRPGLTGLAQVNGRHLLGWAERFELDTWYIDHWSLRLDLRIMAITVKQVVRGRGLPPASADDIFFTGTPEDQ